MKKIVGLLSGVLLASTMAMGMPKEGFQIGPNVGYTVGGDVDSPNIAFGLQASYQFSQVPIKVELGYERLKDSFGINSSANWAGIDMNVNAITLSAWWYFPIQDKFSVYAGGGVGYYMPSVSLGAEAQSQMNDLGGLGAPYGINANIDASADNAFGFHLGVGAEYEVANNFGLFADVRYIVVKFDGTVTGSVSAPGYGVFETESLSASQDWNHFEVRIGGNYKF